MEEARVMFIMVLFVHFIPLQSGEEPSSETETKADNRKLVSSQFNQTFLSPNVCKHLAIFSSK